MRTEIDQATPLVSEIGLACFEAQGRSYALDVVLVREIVRTQEVTPLPNAPELIEGVVELRGGLVPVLDLSRVLGGDRSEVTSRSRIVVIDCDGLLLGLCVDEATDVLSIDPALLEDVPDLATQAGYSVVRGVVRREGAPPVMVLAVETILENVYRSALVNSGEN
jgi:purine-binding chemotaxis protein CheW